AGVDGSKEVVSEVKLVNGKEVARKELSSTVIQEAIPNVVMVGTKPVPAAAPAATSTKSSSKSSGSSSVSYNVPSSGNGSAVASFALQFVGNPYVYGGTSLTNGADCSGFTMAVYAQFGISLPHSSYAQEGYGVSVPLSQAAPGDLVCYGSHIGIYIGNGQMVHASTPSGGIKVSPINYRPVSAIKRLI
ncbi:MAG: NlpC/P60 family protein, partial [Anaerovoracaceae bacterium]